MTFIENFVPYSIILCMGGGIISSALHGTKSRRLSIAILCIVTLMSACVLGYTVYLGHAFVYVMGKFPAPWGNEIRAGVLEAFMALSFSVILLYKLSTKMAFISCSVSGA